MLINQIKYTYQILVFFKKSVKQIGILLLMSMINQKKNICIS